MAARKAPAVKKAPAKRAARSRRKLPPPVDLHALGARVVSVFGPFSSRCLIELPVRTASELFPEPLSASGRTSTVEAVERDLAAIVKRDKRLGESALAMLALALAYQIEHPFNSATSKAACARELREALDRLRELLPAEKEKDRLDDLSARRADRLAKGAAGT